MSKNYSELEMKDFYPCYSMALMRFLRSKGFRWVQKARKVGTYSIYFLYHKSDALQWALKEWSNMPAIDKLPYKKHR